MKIESTPEGKTANPPVVFDAIAEKLRAWADTLEGMESGAAIQFTTDTILPELRKDAAALEIDLE